MEEYNKALKSISDIIKSIGGDGKVHGCIVDIDFYNHIYLNPHDGNISAYYSDCFGDRFIYRTVEKLLIERLPRIYENYKKMITSSFDLVNIGDANCSPSEIMHVFDTTQYKPSRIIKYMQYVTENNIIRIWREDLVVSSLQYCTGKNLIT